MASASVRHNYLLGHLVRTDPWIGQGRSSYALALDALNATDFTRAEDYGSITVQEASEAYELFSLWLGQIPEVLSGRGVDDDTTDGPNDLDTGWAIYCRLIDEFAVACRQGDKTAACLLLEQARSTWRRHHDRACDRIVELLGKAAAAFGESYVGELWDILLSGMYDRAERMYHPSAMSWPRAVERLVLDIFEATRGHLSGPRRDGEFGVIEEDDRWVLTFAPCGSGGRTFDSAPNPRAVTTEPHDWAWNTVGVCLYCAHCCQLQQRAPIARLGFPLRVVEPPTQDKPVCTWSIYKDPSRVPDEAYTCVGFAPPKEGPTVTR